MTVEHEFNVEFLRGSFYLGLFLDDSTSQDCQINELINLAISYSAEGHEGEAISYLKKALKIGERADIYNIMGITYFLFRKYPKSFESFKKALDVDPEYFEAYYNLGAFLHYTEFCDYAIEMFDDLLENVDISRELLADVCNGKACILYKKGEKKEAMELFEKAIFVNQESIASYYNLGNIYFLEGNLQEAEKYYKKVIEIDEKFPEVYNNLGLVAVRKNDLEGAQACFDRAISLDESFELAKDNKKLLKKYKQNVM